MINLKDIQKLMAPKDSPEHLSRRKPDFWNRYEGTEDKFDFDLETIGSYEAVFRFFFERYFRVQALGVQNIPSEGSVILAGNHSGTVPIDALMTFQAALDHHNPRRVRYLVLPWFKKIAPIWDSLIKLGAVEATFHNALALLEDNEIVGIYPEAERAMTKSWKEKYRLRDFDPGFVKLAIATQTPIVPVVVIGAEETYPNFGNWDAMAKFIGMPLFPITLTFPWLPFPLGFAPMPARWLIQFGKPIHLNYSPDKSFDTELVNKITAEIQQEIQNELNSLLARRRSIVAGWDEAELYAHELNSAKRRVADTSDLMAVE